MAEENATSTAAPADPGAADVPVTEPQIINGGIEIEVFKIDATVEKVRVRQLPIGLIAEWGRAQGDEAYLVELLCDKLDRKTQFHLRNAQMTEMRLLAILQQADFKQIGDIEKNLARVRAEIEAHEAKPRWSDTITHDSAAEIRRLGERLNKKKFVEQTIRTTTASKALLNAMPQESPELSSSSPSPESEASPSVT